MGNVKYRDLRVVLIILGMCLIGSFSQAQTLGSLHLSNGIDQGHELIVEEGMDLKQALEHVEKQFNVVFLYRTDAMKGKRVTSTVALPNNIKDALTKLLDGQKLEFKYLNPKTYGIFATEEAPEKEEITPIEQVSGTVTDAETGENLPGVNILVKGTTTGASTDMDGNYELTVPSLQDTLIFSFIGYQTQQVAISGRATINIDLQPEAISGEEMVVVGYGVARATEVSGSVATVSAEELSSKPATNVASLLQGVVPGLQVTQATGRPGAEETSMLIRGLGTMNNASPMVIVDGMESSLDDINPNDIADISVLKDASSAAIYGTRAANGVILITTKRGRAGSPEVSYNTYVGWQEATRLPDYLPSYEYAKLLNEARLNEGQSVTFTEEEIRNYESGDDPFNFPNTDWLDLLLQGSGFTQNHDLRFSGGNPASRYSVSLGFNEQFGLVNKTSEDQYNLRINLDSNVNDLFDIGLNAALTQQNVSNVTGHGGHYIQVNRIPPTVPNKFEDGSWARHIDGNPIAWIEDGGKEVSQNNHLVGSVFAEAQLSEVISLRGRAGWDYNISDNKSRVFDITYGDGSYQGPNEISESLFRDSHTDLDALLKFNNNYNSHDINGLLGVSRRTELFRSTTGFRRDLPSNALSALDAGSTEGMSNSGNDRDVKLGSYFGRINYVYDDKYIFEANLRRDGSSKFARGQRWGWFPSFSAGWILTEENFLGDISMVDFLRLRASWGRLGNHRISDYIFIANLELGQIYPFGESVNSGAAQATADNPNVTWEVVTEWNIGADIELFENLFSISADYYDRFTDDILTSVPVSTAFGLPAPVVNAGAMSNKGIEVELKHFDVVGDFSYDVSLNTAFNQNKVERFESPDIDDTIRMEGIPWDSFYGYEWIGYFQTDEEAANNPTHHPNVGAGDLKFRDQDGDGEIDADDRVVLGNSIPEITFGLNLGLKYKGFDFSAFFQGADKVYRTIGEHAFWPFFNGAKAQSMHLDRMIVQNGQIVEEGYYPRTLTDGAHNRTGFSSFQVYDAAYVRLKNLQLGYSFSPTFLGLSNARIYFSGQNLLTFTRAGFPDFADPESTSAGLQYPQVKFYTFGLDITF